jgi:hypothetical protein
MSFLKSLFAFFSPYAHPLERKVDRFFKRVSTNMNVFEVRQRLQDLMQENLVVVNLFMEYRFKGYKYLNKRFRRQLYHDVGRLIEVFNEEVSDLSFEDEDLKAFLGAVDLNYQPHLKEKLIFLTKIMWFFRPGRYYSYIKTASFGKLLRDPKREKLEGDCNQIVTLYAFFYSLKYPISDLEIKLLPEHVCLHFQGIDIEATTANYVKYKDFEHLLPITELISTNLLDLADFRENIDQISPRSVVKSAELAYSISSLKSLVQKNLKVSYQNLALYSADSGDYDAADFFAVKSKDDKVKSYVYSKHYNSLAKKVENVMTKKEAKKYKKTYRKMLDLAQKLGDRKLIQSVKSILKA